MEPIDRDEFIAMLNEDHIPYDARINSILMSVPVLNVVPIKFHNKSMEIAAEEKKDMVKIVYCKDCIHRWVNGVAPHKIGNVDIYLWIDTTCPFENTEDDFFCAKGEKNEIN